MRKESVYWDVVLDSILGFWAVPNTCQTRVYNERARKLQQSCFVQAGARCELIALDVLGRAQDNGATIASWKDIGKNNCAPCQSGPVLDSSGQLDFVVRRTACPPPDNACRVLRSAR
jgi:hypothetical protein